MELGGGGVLNAYGVCDPVMLQPRMCGSEQLRINVCSELLSTAGWVSGGRGVFGCVYIPANYALVYQLCACLSVSPCVRVC